MPDLATPPRATGAVASLSLTAEAFGRLLQLARAGALIALAAGAAALAGWALGMDPDGRVPAQAVMKASTGLCLLIEGTALWMLTGRPSSVRAHGASAMAAVVALIAAAVLGGYATGSDLGIDAALSPGSAGAGEHPGRMAPGTAVALILVAGALTGLDVRVRGRWPVAPALATAAAVLALLALAGHAVGITTTPGMSGAATMSVPTTIAVLALAIGVFLTRPGRPPALWLVRDTPGAAALRCLVPVAVALPAAVAALRQTGAYGGPSRIWLVLVAANALGLGCAWRLARSLDRVELRRRDADASARHVVDATATAAADELAAQQAVLQRLALAAEYRDDDTGEHTRRVGELSARLATRAGLCEEEIELVRHAAPLHDVGKIGVPDSILLKPGPLTAAEFERVKAHTHIGASMLAGRGFRLLEVAEQIALTHHERWDGGGYPHGLAGEDIPLVGRIVALADVFDALTHDRPYKSAWTVEQAVARIAGERGRQFDPALADAFIALIREPGLVQDAP